MEDTFFSIQNDAVRYRKRKAKYMRMSKRLEYIKLSIVICGGVVAIIAGVEVKSLFIVLLGPLVILLGIKVSQLGMKERRKIGFFI